MTFSSQHQPRKRFGQNFLHDPAIISRIIELLRLKKTDHVVEIGPGLGALTQHLLPQLEKLDVVELDRDLIPELIKNYTHLGKLIVHSADALRFNFTDLSSGDHSLRLIGNLPYNISTPLLFHLLEQSQVIHDMHFMLQKEVAERIVAAPGDKQYGRLSVMIQYHCETSILLAVKSGAFFPPPKVDSAIIRLIPYKNISYPAKNTKNLLAVVTHAFNQRRKTLRNSLSPLITAEQMQAIGIDPIARAETLTVKQFVELANLME